jgi:hypothetical protein
MAVRRAEEGLTIVTTHLNDPTTGRGAGDTGDTHRAVVRLGDREHHVRRWVNTWAALGTIVVLVVIGYLVFISSALAKIDDDLGIAQDAVVDSEGNMKTLPGQLSVVNSNLRQIDKSLSRVPGYAAEIRSNLEAVESTSGSTSISLASAAPRLDTIAEDLSTASSTLRPVASGLTETSTLLAQILLGTDNIDSDLVTISGASPRAGIRGLANGVQSISSSLSGAESELGDVVGRVGSINGHLLRVCKSAPINLLHGRQPC